MKSNKFKNGLEAPNIDTDIMYCYKYYVEPKFNYDAQNHYWMNLPATLSTMANDDSFHDADIKLTSSFIDSVIEKKYGGKVLDVCGGIGRCGPMLANYFDAIDIFDISPGFGDLNIEK